jgi:subtilase family serine protease
LHSLSTPRTRAIAAAAVAGLLISTAAPSATAAVPTPGAPGTPGTSTCHPGAGRSCPMSPAPILAITDHIAAAHLDAMPTESQCEADYGLACYTGEQLRTAYDLAPLYQHGITGAGRTIVLVDGYDDPTLQQDLDTYDAAMGLPNTTVTVKKYGNVPAFDPTNAEMEGWAGETELDIEIAHLYAPGAKIVVAAAGVDANGDVDFPQLMAAVKGAVGAGGDVVSMSWGDFEQNFYDPKTGYAQLTSLRGAFQDALDHHVTLVAATGDTGAAGIDDATGNLTTVPEVSWPGSDPDVVAAGGTELNLDAAGNRLSPDVVWNDGSLGYGAGGGGRSVVFPRPAYQNTVASVAGNHRSIPDISTSSAVNGGALIYWSSATGYPGWAIVGGTSESSPAVAAITALADQATGQRLGNIDDELYALQHYVGYNKRSGLVQVTQGNNTWGGVTGFSAGPGYSLAAGLGTLNAYQLVDALARSER